MVRITGRDYVDIFVSPHREVTEWVARTIDDALRGTAQVDAPVPDAPRAYDGARTRRSRVALMALGMFMITAGVTMLLQGFPWTVPGVYVLIFAAAPFGLAFGTREKEFYL